MKTYIDKNGFALHLNDWVLFDKLNQDTDKYEIDYGRIAAIDNENIYIDGQTGKYRCYFTLIPRRIELLPATLSKRRGRLMLVKLESNV